MAVYGYIRVSTTTQAEEGESLGVQQRQIDGYALQLGLEVDKVFIEKGVSGSKPLSERPQGRELLSVLSKGDVVIAAKLDRMFRSAIDALQVLESLKQQGVSLHLIDLGGDVTGNGIAKTVFTILSAVAEAERDRIRERIKDVKADQKKRGRHLGGSVPFGYTLGEDNKLVENRVQQAAIKLAIKRRAEGYSLRDISDAINESFCLSVSHVSVKRILRDEGYQ